MTETATCPKCGTELPADAPAGICPKCLMQAGLAGDQDAGSTPWEFAPTTLTSGFVPPEPEELAPKFPQLEILELLGKGGMGAVYKARQPGLDRFVALKILPPEVGADPAFAERFTREARALAKLSHQNIVSVFDSGEADGQYYFIMEYVEGANLRHVIQTEAVSPEEALAIVPQICEALQFAHDKGVVHRDIKPENILVDTQGRVKIADFGLAKLLDKEPAEDSLTGTHQAMGTLHYMAPEQMRGAGSVDHRADIYSLGVVFYELLTGQLPIGRFDPPSHKVQVDVRLDEVVLRSLESEPDRRYQHVTELQTDVESISSDNRPITRPAKVSDGVMFRRLTKFNLILGSIWVAILTALNWGYVADARWYFEEEFPFTALSTLFAMFSLWLVMCSATWWYLLAKRPDTPRSFADFCRAFQTPDQRMRRVWKPGLIYAGIWMIAVVISWPFGDTAQLVCYSSGFMLLPFVGMAIVKWAYPEHFRVEAVTPASGSVPLPHLVQGPADCLLLAAGIAFVTACGVAAWLLAVPAYSSNQFTNSMIRGNLIGMSVTLASYSVFVGVTGLMLRRLRARLVVLLVDVIVGLFFPAVVALNVLMELRNIPVWPVVIPLWLGMPAALWVVVTLFRADVRCAFDAAAEQRAKKTATGAVSLHQRDERC